MVELIPSTPGSLSVDHLQRTLGVFFVGFMFALILYGFTVFQSYMYYSRYPKDSWTIKTAVVLLCCLDSAVSVLLSKTLYYHMVDLFPYTTGIEFAATTYCAQLTLVAAVIFVAQLVYAFRIWTERKNAIVGAAIAMFATAGFVLGIVTAVKVFQDREFSHLAQNPTKTIAAITFGVRAVGSILTLIALSLGPQASDMQLEKSGFDLLVSYGVSRGGACVVVQLALIFVFVGSPQNMFWSPFHDVATKLFVVGALTLLNSRNSAESRNRDDLSWESRTNASTLGNSRSNAMAMSGVEFNNGKAPIVIEVAQTTHHDDMDRMNYGIKPDQSYTDGRSY